MFRLAVIGGNDTLSKNILELLALRGYPKENVSVFKAHVQGTQQVSFGEEDLPLKPLSALNPADFDAAVVTENDKDGALEIFKLAEAGVKVINATAQLGGEDGVPMVVGGINEEAALKAEKNIVSVPHPCVVQLLTALAEINAKYRIKNIRLSTYASVDFEGQDGMSELYNATRRILMNDTSQTKDGLFHKTPAFNVVPQAGCFIGEETSAEWVYNAHVKQVLGGKVKVHANCAVVPAFVGLGIYANVETEADIDSDEARDYIKKTKGVLVMDKQEDGGYASLIEAQGESAVFVSRVRQDMTVENGISLWVAGDAYKVAAQNILALVKQIVKKDK